MILISFLRLLFKCECMLWFIIIVKIIRILLHAHPLLGSVLVNKFPRRQIVGKQSVARLRNNR
jgi:hypothetical protein